MVNFTATVASNTHELDALKGLTNLSSFNYSNRSLNHFTATDGSDQLRFTGTLFTYNPLKHFMPNGGTTKSVDVFHSNALQYSLTGVSISISHITDYTQPANLFSGNDTMLGSGAADSLFGQGGQDNINGRGGNDLVVGNAGNDKINGGLGADRHTGNAGNDTFIFNTNRNAGDTITDFNKQGVDHVSISENIFPGIGSAGPLASSLFHEGSSATTLNQRIIYDPNANPAYGVLYYDPDGSGSGAHLPFARIIGVAHMTASDFIVAA